jgi:hypothetical protein
MVVERPEFDATSQDTVAVVHHLGDFDLAIVTTRLEVGGTRGVTEITEKLRVAPDADGSYTLGLNVPEPDLVKGAPWVVTVLLPPGARYRGTEDNIEQLPRMEAGSPAVTWTADADTLIPEIWNYLP